MLQRILNKLFVLGSGTFGSLGISQLLLRAIKILSCKLQSNGAALQITTEARKAGILSPAICSQAIQARYAADAECNARTEITPLQQQAMFAATFCGVSLAYYYYAKHRTKKESIKVSISENPVETQVETNKPHAKAS